VLRKYERLQRLGKGAYGVVWKAYDKKNKETVALKKIFGAFQNSTDAQRTFREIMFLQQLRHDNIIRLNNVLKAENDKDIYLIFEYMDTDLHAVIRANILEDIHKQYIIYQLLKTLKYLHSGELLHRDIKPNNLLLNSECHMKLADFGLARSIHATDPHANKVLTDYIATRWYRAPEILMGSTAYTKGIDMWSVGCILGELLAGKPIFPGQSTMNQLERIIAVTGRPTPSDIESIKSPFAQTMLDNLGNVQQRPLGDMFPRAPADATDLMKRLLIFNPNKRLTAEEALKHPYVSMFHNPAEEGICKEPLHVSFDDYRRYTVNEYREKLYSDIARKKKERKRERLKRSHRREVSSSSGQRRGTTEVGQATGAQ
jgi:mitogen-activated protein kinase 15